MRTFFQTMGPVAVFVAAVAAALATMLGASDAGLPVHQPAPAAQVPGGAQQPFFIFEQFADEKRNAAAADLPPQF